VLGQALLEQLPADADFSTLVNDEAIEPIDVGQSWSLRLETRGDRRQAVFHLFEACRKPVDGIISRNLNRHVSIFISKRLVNTPVTPNAMTIITFLVSVVAAYFAAQGGYFPTLVGAILLQCNSILDGVDGELARVRFQYSRLGQWLDTIGDDASNALFAAALAWGARSLPWGTLLSTCGWIAAGTGVVTAALYYSELISVGSGDLNVIEYGFDKKRPTGLRGKLIVASRYVMKQDFFIFLWMCAAAVGLLSYGLPLLAIGGVGTVIAATGRRLSRRKARQTTQRKSR